MTTDGLGSRFGGESDQGADFAHSGKSGCEEGGGMFGLVFWLLWLSLTAYLHEQWQRYEPTRVAIDGAAAVAALPFSLLVALSLV